ncbi:hypothetical protein [Acinetobacter dispersus]|uniref:hypothetical protein n=1 Tax=Acinetobacter dispersus TaxID=70348 RepID=UPI000517C89C|nr:hypothetical protein [Acinetobacter dispersus]
MHLPLEIMIVIGIVGFYIYDSAHLYFYNEFNIQKGFKAAFKSQLISRKFNFSRQYLVIQNLLLSHQLIFKCAWKFQNAHSAIHPNEIEHIREISQALKPLQIINILSFILTLGILPFLLIYKADYLAISISLVMIYGLNLFSIFFVMIKREILQLSWFKTTQLLLDVLLCPPFAVNLLRKISLNYQIKTEGILFASQILDQEHYQQLLDEILLDIQTLKTASSEKRVIQLELREQQLRSIKYKIENK